MPSKATMSSHISKTKMSSVITCLQKATMTLIYISKTKMSSPQNTSISFSPVRRRTQLPLYVHLKKRISAWKWKWKWIKREKKEFQYLHAFTEFTAWICASGRSGKDSARTKLVSYLYFPFISNKRKVKRDNCHTLISSGDHYLLACNLRLTTSKCLTPVIV